MDQGTRKLMMTHKTVRSIGDIDMCQEKERWIDSIEDKVDTSIQGLEDYIKKSKERLISAIWNNY